MSELLPPPFPAELPESTGAFHHVGTNRLTITTPAQPLHPAGSVLLLQSLWALRSVLTVELCVTASRTQLCVSCPASSSLLVERAIRSALPQCGVTRETASVPAVPRPSLTARVLKQAPEDCLPIRDLPSFAPTDPFSLLIGSLLPLRSEETCTFSYCVRPAPEERLGKARQALYRPVPISSDLINDAPFRALGHP
jgi:hypothetical protein